MNNDDGLLGLAAHVLRKAGFGVLSEALTTTDSGWILAENDLFVVAVVAGSTVDELHRLESFAAPELINRLTAANKIGSKRWDAYLVLLTPRPDEPASQSPADVASEARALLTLQYDTRGVRRLAATKVEPIEDDMRRVLRPFLPLPAPREGGLADSFHDLVTQLEINGVPSEDAHRAVAIFRATGDLGDL